MRNIQIQLPLAVLAVCFLAAVTPAYATFPGRNGRIAFQAQASSDAHIQIYTVRPNGRDLRQITHLTDDFAIIRPDGTHYEGGDVQALVGSYSPDGRWIVFRLENHGSYGLYKMRADGSHIPPILSLSNFKPASSRGAPERAMPRAKMRTSPLCTGDPSGARDILQPVHKLKATRILEAL